MSPHCDCVFLRRDDAWVCRRCGYRFTRMDLCPEHPPHRNCLAGCPVVPGDVLHRLIVLLFREKPTCECECTELQRKMNTWGWRSILHAGEIAEHMRAEAEKREWKLAKTWPKTTRLGCRGLVVAAVALATIQSGWFVSTRRLRRRSARPAAQ